jgi:hypothetical protein
MFDRKKDKSGGAAAPAPANPPQVEQAQAHEGWRDLGWRDLGPQTAVQQFASGVLKLLARHAGTAATISAAMDAAKRGVGG